MDGSDAGAWVRRAHGTAAGTRAANPDQRQPKSQVERAGALHTLGLLAVLYRGSRQGCVLLDW